MMRHWKFWENDGGSFSLFPGNGGLLLEFPIAIRQNLHILLGISLKYNTWSAHSNSDLSHITSLSKEIFLLWIPSGFFINLISFSVIIDFIDFDVNSKIPGIYVRLAFFQTKLNQKVFSTDVLEWYRSMCCINLWNYFHPKIF